MTTVSTIKSHFLQLKAQRYFWKHNQALALCLNMQIMSYVIGIIALLAAYIQACNTQPGSAASIRPAQSIA